MNLIRPSDAGTVAVSESFGWGLVASLALHAALLDGIPDLWTPPPMPAPPALEARIEPAAGTRAEAPAAARKIEAPRAGAPVRARARLTAPEPEPDSGSLAGAPAERPGPSGAELASLAEPPGAIEAESAGSAASETAPSLAGAGAALAAASGDAAPDLDALLAQYRHALAGAARREKVYPRYAVERGWEGKVAVQLRIGANGELARAIVKSSSGYSILHRQAIETLKAAKRLTPIPPALAHHEFAVEILISFGLTDG